MSQVQIFKKIFILILVMAQFQQALVHCLNFVVVVVAPCLQSQQVATFSKQSSDEASVWLTAQNLTAIASKLVS